ncbi:MAG: MarR family transcriptional regulator [Clostridia bacterium]|nr:MarR family transcriptional regulator [Clostridia bacterium]
MGIMNRFRTEFESMDLTGPQGMLIGTLFHKKQLKISELSKMMSLSNSTVSGIVDRLEKAGKVERIRSEKDRRVVEVRLSDSFRKNTKCRHDIIENHFSMAIKDASKEQLDAILYGLETLEKLIKNNQEKETDN